jgi:hypothetical protein
MNLLNVDTTLIALLAMICGPIPRESPIEEARVKDCYKKMITCVERYREQHARRVNPDPQAIKECLLEEKPENITKR